MRTLMSSTGDAPKSVQWMIAHVDPLAALLLLGAIGYGLYSVSPDAVLNTRVSENALLPGLVDERMEKSRELSLFTKGLRDAFKNGNPQEYINKELRKHRLEVYTQAYNSSTPFATLTGRNLYAFSRAFRAAPVESILVVVPIAEDQVDSLAIAMATALYAR
ncbi:glycosylphosphatidylinositol anchor attachment 1 protein-like protein, partial [Aphelenchoides avenae]